MKSTSKSFQYYYRAKPWMDEVMAIRAKYLNPQSTGEAKRKLTYALLSFLSKRPNK